MNVLATAYGYAEGVKNGSITVNRYVKLAIERHFKDMEASQDLAYPFYFCEKTAQKALRFFDFLVLTKGVSKKNVPADHINPDGTVRFVLQPWQAFKIASIFGWKKKADGLRRFTEAYTEIPKKNAKTTTAAGIAGYMLIADGEAAPDVYFSAYTQDQANIGFKEIVAQIRASPALAKRVRILNNSITIPDKRAHLSAVSNDAKNTEGKNTHCGIVDEYHVHANDELKNSIQSGQANRSQPLLEVVTTAGFNRESVCYKHRELCIGMLEGKYALDNVFALIYGLDEGDDWKDPANWIKVNPSIGVTVQMDFLHREFQKALRSGTKEVDFKTKHLNMWVDAAETWIASEIWNPLARPDFTPPKGAVCYGGLDLATTRDICAFSLYFPEYDFFTRYFYVPKAAVERSASTGVDYSEWVNAGHLIVAGDKSTDYDRVILDIETAFDFWDLQFIGFDRWGAKQIESILLDKFGTRYVQKKGTHKYEETPVLNQFGQGYASMSPPAKAYEKAIVDGEMCHDGNPVMAWMVGNVVMTSDAAGNIKPDKAKSSNKIDGVVSDIMALGTYETYSHTLIDSDEPQVW